MIALTTMLGGPRAGRMVERNYVGYRRMWLHFVTGLAEPVFYLLSVRIGIAHLVGDVTVGGKSIPYDQFVAPALMAAASMNGAVIDSTFVVFYKLKYAKMYDAVLATPMSVGDVALGEIEWALIRGGIYAAVFFLAMVVTGLVSSPWAVLDVPAALLVAFAFAGAGMASTSFMTTWQQFDLVMVAIVPMFLFSATFYPLSTYPPGLRFIVECTPLYQGVALMRSLAIGDLSPVLLLHALYLALMGTIGLRIADKRLAKLLLP